MKKNLRNYIIIGSTAALLTFGSVGAVYAASFSRAPVRNMSAEQDFAGGRFVQDVYKADFSKLVNDGIISQETADKIAAYMETQNAERQAEMEKVQNMTEEERKAYFESVKDQKVDLFTDMVNTGIITQAEADAIKAAQPQTFMGGKAGGYGFGGMGGFMNTDALVENGIISQETADKIAAYMENQKAERQAEMEKVQNMTEEERQAYFDSVKDQKVDLLANMVNSGIITQAEADAIKAAQPQTFMGGKVGGHGFGVMDDMGCIMNINTLVENGTISQETADKIAAYIQKQNVERQAEMEKFQNMTEEERQAYVESVKGQKVDLFADMVKTGVITQAEADAIKAAQPQTFMGGKAGGRGMGGMGCFMNTDALVENGTISQETADKIAAYIDKRNAECQAEMEKVQNMTEEERKAYFDSLKDQKVDLFTDMVNAGVITQSEADAIKAAQPQNFGSGGRVFSGMNEQPGERGNGGMGRQPGGRGNGGMGRPGVQTEGIV